MTIREQNEQREHAVLEPWATFADSSAGRLRPMEPCPYRTCFQRDRDRIIHSKAFRRLRGAGAERSLPDTLEPRLRGHPFRV